MLRKAGHKAAPDVGNLLLVTLEGDKVVVEHEEKVIDEIIAKHGGKKVSDEIAQHEWDERSYEFRCRELGLGAVPGEVVVPLPAFKDMVNDLYDLKKSMKMEAAIIGIMADRNTVMFMPYFVYDAESMTKSAVSLAFDAKAGDLTYKYGGRPLAGFGLFQAPNLKKVRPDAIGHMKAIKDAIDPKEVMNPGKMFGMKTRFGLPIPISLYDFGMTAMSTVKKIMPKDQMVDKKAKQLEQEELEKEKSEQYKTK